MTAKWSRVQGDTNDTLTAQLAGITPPLTGVVEGHIWPVGGGTSADLEGTVIDEDDLTVSLDLAGWITTADAGDYHLEIEVTAAGDPKTWPSEKPALVRIRAQGA